MKVFSIGAAVVSLTLAAWSAQAALIPVDGGRLVDDTANDTLWVADANLFKTLANAEGDPAAFVQKVIAAAGGVIDDTPCETDTPAYSGHYSLTASDFYDTDAGIVTWYGAQAFIIYLNSIKYLGYSDWRQPVTIALLLGPTPTGTGPGDVAPSLGELSELFYTELGARYENGQYLTSVNGYAALFKNLGASYHYATEGSEDPSTAGIFVYGFNFDHDKGLNNKDPATVWPVRRGQASLHELIGGVAKQLPTADQDGRASLDEASKRLERGCEDLKKFLEQESKSKDALLDADVKAIGRAVGCR